MKIKSFIAAATAAIVFAVPASAQDIDLSGPVADQISAFGVPDTATYGQTFTVGAENALNSFTMYLGGNESAGRDGGTINFRAYVYAWNGARAVGGAIYTSDEQQFGFTSDGAVQAFNFDTTGTTLVSGNRYVAFLTTSGVLNNSSGSAWMPTAGALGTDAYSGGDFVYFNNGTQFASLTARDWDYAGGVFGDAQFKADFSAGATSGVPEPAAWGMLIGGFGFAGAAIRRRRAVGSLRLA
ncbi:PEPxxWA-CTERM sorting domain-containing protein [Sphingomonas sp. RS6]